MQIDENKARKNIEYAKRWLNRAIKDFNLFKKLVPFDKKTNKPVRCSDPALAVYLLQQCIEKAIKAAAIASGQYKAKDYIRYYRHNSLALILNLNLKMITKIKDLGLDSMAGLMGLDSVEGESKLITLESQVMGKIPLISKDGKKVSVKYESISLPPEIIDKLLDTAILSRRKMLDIIKTTFGVLPDIGINKGTVDVENPEEFIREITEKITSTLQVKPPSEEQLKVPLELMSKMSSFGATTIDNIGRKDMTTTYLGVWAFSYSLLWLSYITFAHESTSRYPLKRKGNIKTGKIGCDDYEDNLGIVNRIGKIGYATSLTLNEMKNEIESIAHFFAADGS